MTPEYIPREALLREIEQRKARCVLTIVRNVAGAAERGMIMEKKHMDIMEKLIEILENSFEKQYKKRGLLTAPHTVEDLIANGVTVQEWISVDDELPEVGGYVVCIAKRNPFSRFMPMVARIEKNGWVNPITEQYISEVTHWMPLPSAEGLE